ncbi:Ig-like domain-containing protein [Aquamicrobium zhengzhouense]|uniref:Cadherin domain-containing protein n=1 Tax=Aquamicrobium zhengzhouense TaxID=2781738 RepID=A0ABS0SGG0_9HYPH|nr:Ig-like domain-containing protein [Aquamicrobium zhengzhouense]MBI1621518.1 hypothetical protein [Aquamicrobium zhengzhouense]
MAATLEGMSVTITLELQGWFEHPIPISSTPITVGAGLELDAYFSTRILSDTDGNGTIEPVPGPNGLFDGRVIVDISGNSIYASYEGQAQPGAIRIKIEGLAPEGVAPGSFQHAGSVNGVNLVQTPTYTAATKVLQLDWITLGFQPGTAIDQTIFYDNELEDAPVAGDDDFNVRVGQELVNKNILSNDSDLDNLGEFGIVDPLSVTEINGMAFTPDQWMSLFGGGEIKIGEDGRLDFRDAGAFAHLSTGQTDEVTFTYTVSDSTGKTDTGTVRITVEGVNTLPTATNLAQAKTAVEDGTAVALDHIVVTDPDAGETITATMTLLKPSAGSLSTGTYGSATSTFNSATGVWQVAGSVADVNAALAAVSFRPSENYDQDFSISVRIRDAAGTGPADGTINFTVTPVNDAPTLTAPPAVTVTEDAASAITGISFGDVDAGSTPVTATFSVASGTLSAQERAEVTVAGSGTGSVILSGTITDLNAFIAAGELTYTTALNATGSVSMSVTIDDKGSGTDLPLTDSATITLNVTGVNDAPTIILPADLSVVRDRPSIITGITFADIDAGTGLMTATVSVPAGSLSAMSGNGVIIGGTPSALTLTGTLTDINSFIASEQLSYRSAPGASATVTLTVVINDGGNTGSGGALQATQSLTMTVENLSPAPDPQPEPPAPATLGADLLRGTPGDDVIDGRDGVDVFRIEADWADVTITRNPDGTVTISHPDFGTDLLKNVELLRFNDRVEILNPPIGSTHAPNVDQFPEAAYLLLNPGVAQAVADGVFSSGLEHYLLHGASEGRLPQLAFDEQFYLSQNQDVAEAVEQGAFSSAYEHYLLHGKSECRSPNVLFDDAWYLDQNPDVARAIDAGLISSAYEHFQTYGWKEGRDPSAWMDLSDYLGSNPDVAYANVNPLDHFLNHGFHEDRTIRADDSGLWIM